jgi:NarL family two-component system response regulator LiaR
MSEMIKVLLVDAYPVVLAGLITMFKNHPSIEVAGVANNGKKAVDLALSLRPHVVIMDIVMPEMDGIETARRIKQQAPEIQILIFTGTGNIDQITPALSAGVTGYTMKDASEMELLQAVIQVAKGEAWLHPSVMKRVLKQMQDPEEEEGLIEKLTERELAVLNYMAKGNSNQEIAKLMVVSAPTVHSHVSRILSKLNVSSRTQAVIYAMRAGVIKDFSAEE